MTPAEMATAALTAPEWVAYMEWSEKDLLRRYGKASQAVGALFLIGAPSA